MGDWSERWSKGWVDVESGMGMNRSREVEG